MTLRDLRVVSHEPPGPPELNGHDPDAPLSPHDLESALLDLYAIGLQPGEATPWESLRPYYTIKPGLVTVVTGTPHSGKSPFVNAIALHCAMKYHWPIAWCSPEHLPYEDLLARLLEQFYKRLSFSQGQLMRMSTADVCAALDVLQPYLRFLPASETDATIHGVLQRALPLVEQIGLKGLIIDPYGEFEHKRPNGMTETEYVSQLLTEIRLFARRYAVHVWIIAHPTKIQKDQSGKYPVVKPYDISGSAAWFNKPDHLLSIYRDYEQPNHTQIHSQKSKFRECGQVGSCTLRHDPCTGTFYDMPIEESQEHD